MLGRSVGFNSTLLGIFALITAGVVATTQQMTKAPIEESRIRAAQAALYEIIPRDAHDNDLLQDTLPIAPDHEAQLGIARWDAEQKQMHLARREGEPFAVIVPTVAPDGYGGPIEMIMGIDQSGKIIGLRVTRHNETPGLGDYIDIKKGNWILSFNGKTLDSAFEDGRKSTVSREDSEFDQLTGATITRNAVSRQVKRTLSFFNEAKPLEMMNEDTLGQP